MSAPKNLGGVDLLAATAANIFQGSSAGGTFTVSFCNRSANIAKVRLGFSDTSATFEDANYLEYDAEIPANGVLERTGLIWEDATKYIVAQSDIIDVSAVAYGWEA